MSDNRPSILERAFQLANDGSCRRLNEIVDQLIREDYENVRSHLGGVLIKRQLTSALKRLDK